MPRKRMLVGLVGLTYTPWTMKNRATWALLLAPGCAVILPAGCSRDARLAGKDIPHVTVKTVSHYGQTLDQSATPEQVAYVTLRAIRDDFLAKSKKARNDALSAQFDVCAADVIARKNRSGLDRDEFIYNVVYHWTPTVSHYVQDFDLDWPEAQKELVRRDLPASTPNAPEECAVRMELNDPGGNPNARVVMIVWLARDEGYWRVTQLGFDNTTRSIRHAGTGAQETTDEGT